MLSYCEQSFVDGVRASPIRFSGSIVQRTSQTIFEQTCAWLSGKAYIAYEEKPENFGDGHKQCNASLRCAWCKCEGVRSGPDEK